MEKLGLLGLQKEQLQGGSKSTFKYLDVAQFEVLKVHQSNSMYLKVP